MPTSGDTLERLAARILLGDIERCKSADQQHPAFGLRARVHDVPDPTVRVVGDVPGLPAAHPFLDPDRPQRAHQVSDDVTRGNWRGIVAPRRPGHVITGSTYDRAAAGETVRASSRSMTEPIDSVQIWSYGAKRVRIDRGRRGSGSERERPTRDC